MSRAVPETLKALKQNTYILPGIKTRSRPYAHAPEYWSNQGEVGINAGYPRNNQYPYSQGRYVPKSHPRRLGAQESSETSRKSMWGVQARSAVRFEPTEPPDEAANAYQRDDKLRDESRDHTCVHVNEVVYLSCTKAQGQRSTGSSYKDVMQWVNRGRGIEGERARAVDYECRRKRPENPDRRRRQQEDSHEPPDEPLYVVVIPRVSSLKGRKGSINFKSKLPGDEVHAEGASEGNKDSRNRHKTALNKSKLEHKRLAQT
ncbi:hypothetical protein EDC04DRAFT_3090999 [Pisolithus marmoratus]|nr:hypothetical protein EDC04DRAFT_3090999 [Pisolithus marmoratus]